MANVNTNPQYKANLSYHGFPIQQRKKFSSSVGQIVPVYYDMLNPGDKVRCGYELETRTMPMDSAAMMHITENIDWFFVPIEQIFKLFSEYYYNVQDVESSIFASSDDVNNNFVLSNGVTFPSLYLSHFTSALMVQIGSGSLNQDYVRLMDMLGFPMKRILYELCKSTDTQVAPKLSLNFTLTPWFAWAYNKIWFDYFRLEDRIANDPRYYNIDRFYNQTYINSVVTSSQYGDMIFNIKYCPWEKDFYTYNQIAPIYGNFVVGGLNSPTIENLNQWLSVGDLSVVNPADYEQGYNPSTVLAANHTVSPSTNTGIDTAQIRSAFALEKLLEITRRAGKNYDAQTLAHFGVKVPEGIGKQSYHLGHSESDLVIRDVISTSDTAQSGSSDGAPLGQIAGKAYGFGKDGNVTFEAKCHGILMAVYYARPNVDYIVNGFDKFNAFSKREDFYIPEYDNLGMQPLFGYQVDCSTNVTQTAVFGWQYRYMEYKQKLNEVHGAMAGTLDYWTPSRDIQVPSYNSQTGFSTSFFYVDPTYLNKVMVTHYIDGYRSFDNSWTPDSDGNVNYDIAYETIFNRDPLIHDILISVTKASKMSTYGLPQL